MSQIVTNQFRFESLTIYQESLQLVNSTYNLTKSFTKDETFGLTNQLRRASCSTLLNIAEGSSRTRKDFAHFLNLAKGSCYECVAILDICKNQKYIEENQFKELYEKLNKLSRMISKFQISLRQANNE